MNADKIRDSILLSAVKGLLVPQDDNETPSLSLIQDIERKKAILIAERKIKKPIKTAPFTEDDELFDIPKGWQWCRLGDLLSIVSDGTHKTPKYVDYGIPFLSVQNISSGHLDMSKAKYISEEEHRILIDRVQPQFGDILICRIGTLGKAIEVTWKFGFSIFVSLGVLRPIDGRLTPYIIEVINSPWGRQWIDKVKVGGGTHTNKINLADIPSCPIPLPPLDEQKRIITKIEELLPLVDEYDKAAGELETLNKILPDKLRKSVLQEAIHGNLVPNDIPEGEATGAELLQQILKERQDRENKEKGRKAKKLTLSTIEEEPWDLPEGWCWCKLKDIIDFTSSGTTKNGAITKDSWILDLEDIEKETGRLICKKRFGDVKSKSDKRAFKTGNVLYSKLRPYLNKCIVANEDGYCTTEILAFDFGPIYNRYAQAFLMSPYFVDRVNQGAAGVKMPRVNNAEANDTCFPIPPLSIQHRIVEKIEEVFAAIDNLPA